MKQYRISAVLIAVLMFLCSVTVSAQNGESELLLKSLGVKPTYTSSEYVTRGEAADYIAQITGIVDTGDDIEFSDVPRTHIYYSSISAACAVKAMWTDEGGKFLPDEMITAQDFIVAMLNVAGYKNYAEATGGYPNGYTKLISKYNLTIKELKLSGAITKEQAEIIIEKILMMPYCNATGVSNGGVIYDISENYTVMEQYFSVKEYQAVVTSVDDTYVSGYSAFGEGTVGLTTEEGTKKYLLKTKNAQQYLGLRVYYYLDEKTETVVHIKPKTEAEKLVLNYNNICSISPDRMRITYTENEKSKYADLVYDLTVIYNGANFSQITVEDMLKPNVTLTLVNTDFDKAFEILYVEEFETVIVGMYVVNDCYVSDMHSGESYSLNTEDFYDGVFFYEDGKEVDFRYIHRGDILSIVTDKNHRMRKVYISNRVAEGKVDTLSGDGDIISIDGVEYNPLFDVNTSGIQLNEYLKLYIDYFGNPVSFEKKPMPGGEYVYLINIGKRSGMSKAIDCKIINLNGEVLVCEFDEKFKINGRKGDYDSLERTLLAGGSIHQLVFVTFNGDKIKNISVSNTPEGFATSDKYEKFTLNYSAEAGTCFIFVSNINSQFLASSVTPTFYIPLDKSGDIDEDEVLAGDWAQISFVQNVKPKIKIYDSGISRIPGAVVVYGISGKMGEYIASGRLKNTNVIVVESIIHRLDSETDECRQCIKGMVLGMPIYMYAPDGENFDDLKRGDIIKIGNYRGNELKSYEKVFTLNRERRDSDSVLSPDGEYSEEKPAIDNTQFKSKLNIAGVYGTVEEVGATTTKNRYSVVIRPEGTTDDKSLITVPVTTQKNTDAAGSYVYVYDTSSNSAYSVNLAHIELTGKKVFCFINDSLSKAIVVYE